MCEKWIPLIHIVQFCRRWHWLASTKASTNSTTMSFTTICFSFQKHTISIPQLSAPLFHMRAQRLQKLLLCCLCSCIRLHHCWSKLKFHTYKLILLDLKVVCLSTVELTTLSPILRERERPKNQTSLDSIQPQNFRSMSKIANKRYSCLVQYFRTVGVTLTTYWKARVSKCHYSHLK